MLSTDKQTVYSISRPLYIGLFLLIVSLATFAQMWFGDIYLVIAAKGFSALDFSNWVLYSDNFKQDYPGGSYLSGKSLLPHVYPFLESSFSIPAQYTLILMVYFEIALFSFASIYLFQTLYREGRTYIPLLLLVLFLLSELRFPSLARFSGGLFHGQFYGFADGLSLLAIATFLRGRFVLSALLLTVCFLIHPIKTLFGSFFILGCFCTSFRLIFSFRVVPYMTFGVFSVFWAVFYLGVLDVSDALTKDVFFKFSGFFNSHWYPFELGVLERRASQYLLPFLSSVSLFYVAVYRSSFDAVLKSRLSIGFLFLCVLVFLGVFFSSYESSVTVVKSSLHRASGLILILSVIALLGVSAKDLREGNSYYFCLSLLILFSGFSASNFSSLVYPRYTWPLSLVVLYVFPVVALAVFKRQAFKSVPACFVLISFVVLVAAAVYAYYVVGVPSRAISTWNNWLFIFLVFLAAIIVLTKKYERSLAVRYRPFSLVVFLFAFALGFNWAYSNRILTDNKIKNGIAYKAVQEWARTESDTSSLFVVDPCISYGWRDFSVRSSWGTIQEWFKTGWLYSGKLSNLQEGLRRASFLGIDESFFPAPGVGKRASFKKMCAQARTSFYLPSGNTLLNIANDYPVSYFVMINEQAQKYGGIPEWPVAYRNALYTVVTPPNRYGVNSE